MKRWLASIILTVGCFLLVMTASGAWKDAQIIADAIIRLCGRDA